MKIAAALGKFLLGRPIASSEERTRRVGVLTGVPAFGLDALASAAYGPEAALAMLAPAGLLGPNYILPLMLVILALLVLLSISYQQTIAAYPGGGGSYTVARENLGQRLGLLAAAALMLDYVLNVAVAISAGVGALVSAVPWLHPHTLQLCLVLLAILTIVNLRGTREAGLTFAAPTYLFVLSLGGILVAGSAKSLLGDTAAIVSPPKLEATTSAIGLWMLLRAFASGCTAMTGIEAVSNGVPVFKEPPVRHARLTLAVIVGVLCLLLLGVAHLAQTYHVGAMDQNRPGYQTVLSQITAAVAGRNAVYFVTIAAVLAVLSLSANTSFADFPRVCRLVARDDYLPRQFADRGRRLTYSIGILFLAGFSGLLLVVFKGVTERLIPLFAVGAFTAFCLSQLGMVAHWRKAKAGRFRRVKLGVNAVGGLATSVALGCIIVAKFVEGAWVVVLAVPVLLAAFSAVHRHYARIEPIEKPVALTMDFNEPIRVVLPVFRVDLPMELALGYAYRLSDDVTILHICREEDPDGCKEKLKNDSKSYFEAQGWAGSRKMPQLVTIDSPTRKIARPLLDYLRGLTRQPGKHIIAVMLPEVMERKWWELLLHHHQGAKLAAAILLLGEGRMLVIHVPWWI